MVIDTGRFIFYQKIFDLAEQEYFFRRNPPVLGLDDKVDVKKSCMNVQT